MLPDEYVRAMHVYLRSMYWDKGTLREKIVKN